MEMGDFLKTINTKNEVVAIEKTNDYTRLYGLSLSEEDCQIILKDKIDTLKNEERFEFGQSIIPKLIFTFCDSAYIYQENYVETIGRLVEIFYLYKNESMDLVNDEELIDIMKGYFEDICQGSLDYLEDTCLEDFARDMRRDGRVFLGGEYGRDI